MTTFFTTSRPVDKPYGVSQMNEMLNPDEIRYEFQRQYPNHGSAQWVRLNLRTGPVLARRNIAHQSSPVYVAIMDNMPIMGGALTVRHWMVTIKRQLKSNGSSMPAPDLRAAWARTIGLTASEYAAVKSASVRTQETMNAIYLYERGPTA